MKSTLVGGHKSPFQDEGVNDLTSVGAPFAPPDHEAVIHTAEPEPEGGGALSAHCPSAGEVQCWFGPQQKPPHSAWPLGQPQGGLAPVVQGAPGRQQAEPHETG